MARFALRHWTAITIFVVLVLWALFYLPTTPSWAVIRLKQAIDARDGASAAAYVDFPSVVRQAGYQIVQDNGGSDNVIGEMFGKGAVDMLSTPMASIAQSWTEREVNNGEKDVQIPVAALVGALVGLHRDNDVAVAEFNDSSGRHWTIRMARNKDRWQIVEVDNVARLLGKLRQHRPEPPPNREPYDGLGP
jgi:hypothetical protein